MVDLLVASPFGDEPFAVVPLANAPLVRVIAQARFPPVLSLERQETIAPLQEQLRDDYPILRQAQDGLIITPQGPLSAPGGGTIWRFQSSDGKWQVSVGSSFVALEAVVYTRRAEFFDRFQRALEFVSSIAKPVHCDRLGVRYVDRLDRPEDLADLPQLVRPEVLGIGTMTFAETASITHSICDTVFEVKQLNAQLHSRWGYLPPNATVDPLIEGIPRPSWIFDVDVFRGGPAPFEPSVLANLGKDFAMQCYRFFRWAFTAELLRRFGGAVE